MNSLKSTLLITAPALTLASLSPTASAVTFYNCQSGYEFALNSNQTGAHRKKKSADSVKAINCPKVTLMGKTIGTIKSDWVIAIVQRKNISRLSRGVDRSLFLAVTTLFFECCIISMLRVQRSVCLSLSMVLRLVKA